MQGWGLAVRTRWTIRGNESTINFNNFLFLHDFLRIFLTSHWHLFSDIYRYFLKISRHVDTQKYRYVSINIDGITITITKFRKFLRRETKDTNFFQKYTRKFVSHGVRGVGAHPFQEIFFTPPSIYTDMGILVSGWKSSHSAGTINSQSTRLEPSQKNYYEFGWIEKFVNF